MTQFKLPLPRETDTISDEMLMSKKEADILRLCRDLCPKDDTDEQCADAVGVKDKGNFSKMISRQIKIDPFTELVDFMKYNENLIPLRWLALKFGYGLVQLKSTVEMENEKLRDENADLKNKLEIIEEWEGKKTK